MSKPKAPTTPAKRKKRQLPPPGRKVSLAEARARSHQKFAEAFRMLAKH